MVSEILVTFRKVFLTEDCVSNLRHLCLVASTTQVGSSELSDLRPFEFQVDLVQS